MSSSIAWTTSIIAGLVALSAGVSGCAASAVAVPAAAPTTTVATIAPPASAVGRAELSLLDAVMPELSEAEERTLWQAQRKLIRVCMRARGIDFTYPAWEVSQGKQAVEELLHAAVSSPKKAFAQPAWAKAHGYGFSTKALRAYTERQLGSETGGVSLSAKTDAALFGTGPGETVDLGNGQGQLGYSTTGCAADATRRLYGDAKEFQTLSQRTSNLSGDLHLRVMADLSVSTSMAQWRSCMSVRGWTSLTAKHGQEGAYQKVFDAYDSKQPNARKLELEIAPADAECTLSSGYGVAVEAAELAVARSARQRLSGTILPFLKMRQRALTAATKVLS